MLVPRGTIDYAAAILSLKDLTIAFLTRILREYSASINFKGEQAMSKMAKRLGRGLDSLVSNLRLDPIPPPLTPNHAVQKAITDLQRPSDAPTVSAIASGTG